MAIKRRLLGATLGGGLGGLLNATLCYFEWPASVPDAHFYWHIIPAGLIHGSALATFAVTAGVLGGKLKWILRWAVALPVGWIVGYVSWIPLHMSAFDRPLSRALVWPLDSQGWASALWTPIAYFGCVAILLYLWVAHTSPREPSGKAIIAASTAGVLGSLWFWIGYEQWYFSLLHGTVWGSLVGLALSRSSIVAGTEPAAEQADAADEALPPSGAAREPRS